MSKTEPKNLYLRRAIFIAGESYPRGAIIDPHVVTEKVARDLIASAAAERTDRKPGTKTSEQKPAEQA